MKTSILKRPILRLTVSHWQFSLPVGSALLLLFSLPVLIRLGIWQIERASERQLAIELAEKAAVQTPLDLSKQKLSSENNTFVRVRVQGKIDWQHQFLLENQVHNTVQGYEVLTPVFVSDEQALLVSRGWLPAAPGKLPDIAPPSNISITNVDITGLAVVPKVRYASTNRRLPGQDRQLQRNDDAWPVIISQQNFKEMADKLGTQLLPRIVHPEDPALSYTRIWRPVSRGPLVNYGYAAQWFGMALLLIGIVVKLNTKCRP